MPDLLLELFCEEIPARMQKRAAQDLQKLVTDALVEKGFLYEGAKAFVTPRRLALHIAGLPQKGKDTHEERKGPRVGAPQAAIDGFLKSAGLASIDEAQITHDAKKGDFYVAHLHQKGRPTLEVLGDIIPDTVRTFPWPKSMRWGGASLQTGALRWVRPLQSILCTFGPETEEPEVVSFEIGGIQSGDMTRGHRFHAPHAFKVKRMDDYAAQLKKSHVVLDQDERKNIIVHDAQNQAFAKGLELVHDETLIEEVAGLVEWPVVLMGSFDPRFLELPPEVIRTTIRANQKCFVLKDRQGKLAPCFILVSNLAASDGGLAIIAGNERVVQARLSDARFFWDQDLKISLETRLEKLKTVVFHEKLGTQYNRVRRIEALAKELASLIGADPDLVVQAARLAKADLSTEMVGEFPELQGLMGRYYAVQQGLHPSICAALEEHYKPLGPSDDVPKDLVSVCVGLADKLDMLVSFWSIDEKPTGSKDPYALRRAALGVIRLILDNRIDIGLLHLSTSIDQNLILFFHDRLKGVLRDQGVRHDVIDAVLQPNSSIADNILLITQRIKTLEQFLQTDNGQQLLAAYRRAVNILKAEEKKHGQIYEANPDRTLIQTSGQVQEQALLTALDHAENSLSTAFETQNNEAALMALTTLYMPVEAFFEELVINDSDPAIRHNRLALLSKVRHVFALYADFNMITG